jgi:hypothetical protein
MITIQIQRKPVTIRLMHTPHPTFKPPPDVDGKIWQYMELGEFVSMLHRKALFFVKANKLRDPYEGIIPRINDVLKNSIYKELEQSKGNLQIKNQLRNDHTYKVPQEMLEQFQLYRELVLINPWHYNEYESAAMWNLYSHENAGIAIQSTTRRLSECFRQNNEDTIWIGKVEYLDFSKDWLSEGKDVFRAFVIKRKSFEYENEIRAVTCLPDAHIDHELPPVAGTAGGNIFSPRERTLNPTQLTDKGKYVSADLQVLVEKVYVAPYAEAWFEEVVQSLLSKYGLDAVVTKSDLYTVS